MSRLTLEPAADPAAPGRFLLDGEPRQVVFGALHYFRVPHQLWADRLQRLAAMGCTGVETYVAWNIHQPRADTAPDFSGDLDLGAFVDEAGRQGLDVLVRPGPFICAEWELGGLPSWLLADPALRTGRPGSALRTSEPAWLAHVDAWFDALLPHVVSRQASHGGPVVGVQVENEYGSFGDDRAYLEHLAAGLRRRGVTELLFTSDGPEPLMLSGGTLDDVLATVNFGSRSGEAFATLLKHRPGTPTMVMEFWNGWFDHWGGPHHVRSAEDAAAELDTMLAAGHSVNFYMAHGGASQGVWAGANADDDGLLQPTVSSYDYDAPIAEDGTLTAKFRAFAQVVAARTGRELPDPPPAPARQRPQRLEVGPGVRLDDVLDAQPVVETAVPRSFEELGVHHGVVRYRTTVTALDDRDLTLPRVGDLARVELGEQQGWLSDLEIDPLFERELAVTGAPGARRLDVVVASLGRVNFGPWLGTGKGLRSARLGYQQLYGWAQQGLDLTDLPELDFDTARAGAVPGFFRVEVDVDEPADAWIGLPGWHHGYVFVNGYNLGRYWNPAGPQQTLYAPGPRWRAGVNEVVVCELVRPGTTVAVLDAPDLGPTTA